MGQLDSLRSSQVVLMKSFTVAFALVFFCLRHATQLTVSGGEALRDDPNNGCRDYLSLGSIAWIEYGRSKRSREHFPHFFGYSGDRTDRSDEYMRSSLYDRWVTLELVSSIEWQRIGENVYRTTSSYKNCNTSFSKRFRPTHNPTSFEYISCIN